MRWAPSPCPERWSRRWYASGPSWSGVVVGAYLGVVTVALLVVLAIADGSLLSRLGRALEDEVGSDLHEAPGVFAVVSGVSFAHRDVDDVVLAQATPLSSGPAKPRGGRIRRRRRPCRSPRSAAPISSDGTPSTRFRRFRNCFARVKNQVARGLHMADACRCVTGPYRSVDRVARLT